MEVTKFIRFLILAHLSLCACSNNIDVINSSSLEYYLCHDGIQSGMTLLLPSAVDFPISKSSFCMIQNVSNVTIESNSSAFPAKITCSYNWNGFGFHNITNLKLYGLVFVHCGGEVQLPSNVHEFMNKSNLYIGPHQRAVLLFSNCLDTTVYDVTIQGPYHGFGMLFVNAMGTSNITQVNISNNLRDDICPAISTSRNYSCSGSGIIFAFSKIKISNSTENIKVILSFIKLNNNKNFYSINNNFADMLKGKAPILSGTGLTLMLWSNHTIFVLASGLEVTNNKATHVGGILIAYNTNSSSIILLSYMNVENNTVPYKNTASYSAGITVVSVYGPKKYNNKQPKLLITDSNITYNQALKGSGIFVHLEPFSSLDLSVQLQGCKFVGNQAYLLGSAMLTETATTNHIARRRLVHVRFNDVHAVNNSGLGVSNEINYDVSVFDFTHMSINAVLYSVTFFNNTGSVFRLYNSAITIKGNIHCSNNTSNSGSCFHLIGSSFIQIAATTNCTFSNNTALLSGGAIYADSLGSPFDICTIASYTGSETVFMRFENNHAILDGSDIKSPKLYNCSLFYNNKQIKGSYSFYSQHLKFNQTSKTSISSNVNTLHSTTKRNQVIFSGKTIHLQVTAVDVADNPVYTSTMVSVYPNNGHKWRIEEDAIYHNIYVGLRQENMINTTITSVANTNGTGKLIIQTISHPPISISFNITILQCPRGFDISSKSHKCDCNAFLNNVDRSISCDIQSVTITLPPSSWFGIFREHETQFEAFSFNCPPAFCKQNSIFIPSATSSDPLCKHNRTGIMCGQCVEGLSLVFGSDECHRCSNFWILSLIIYATGGLALVLILFSIKLTVSGGMLGGVIFFANMSLVSLHSDLLSNGFYTKPIKIFMSFLNLNLGFPVCFYSGMNNVSKTALMFAFPLYLWCIVLGLVLISRFSTKVTNLIVGSSVQVLATLIQFSFSKLLLTICDTFTSSRILISSNDSSFIAWYFEGNIKYFTGMHLVLCLVSLAMLVLFILPFLLFISFASYIRFCRSVNYRLRPLLDAYTGPYKHRYRFWFGVRQWLMVLLYLMYSIMRGAHPNLMLAINIIAISGFMILQIFLKPFKSVIINLIDTWFLFLLFTVNIVAFLFVSKNTTIASHSSSAAIAVILSVYLLSVLAVVLYHTSISVRKIRKAIMKVTSVFKVTPFGLKKGNDDDDDVEHYRTALMVSVED